ncbi:MAG TPA: formate-dependent phosphoribosylglycinamide formyltransferase [Candidatus Krumholzibacteria bacterium]|nr:formate-dependent phosphoribosylglycinamide formyltransferase [Candidatus Krumholzibacteria bacterium]
MKRNIQTIMLLGAGELGREVVIAAKRLGKTVVAVDRYAGAPAMQVADAFEVINMLDADQLAAVVARHRPDMIVPEIEAIRTEKLREFEDDGVVVIPTAEATYLTMNRVAIRDVAARELGLRTAKYAYATSLDELRAGAAHTGIPCVVKPVMSSSGKGQSTVRTGEELARAWDYACSNMRGDEKKVIVEEFIDFHLEITLLTIRQWDGQTVFVDPVGHRQERGDYQESWIPAAVTPAQLDEAQRMAKVVTDRLGGAGIFGVEFFVTRDEVVFSELSPRPHDTGMVTMISQDLSEFDLHVRAILGLPIPVINYYGPSASAVILADRESPGVAGYDGVEKALALRDTQVRIFGKPDTRKYRRMGVALARAQDTDAARRLAKQAADCVSIRYE